MTKLPEINKEEVLNSVIVRLATEKAELMVQIASLESLSNSLLAERDSANDKIKELQQNR